MSRKYLYSVTDKALDDALNQSKISNNELRDLFLERGVLISKDTSREELARAFSRYPHDYYDHQMIASALGSNRRREKTTASFIDNKVTVEQFENAAENLKILIHEQNDLCHIVHKDSKSFILDITYQHLEHNKSDFQQVSNRAALIEVEFNDGGFVIRRPDNEQARGYEDVLISNLSKEIGEELGRDEINLVSIDNPELRSLFFKDLIASFSGYQVHDVTDVFVYHPKISSEDDEVDSGVHITKASLKGEGVLSSDEIQSLYDKGFYLCKIRWSLIEDSAFPDIYEFEAQFSNPEEFTGFSYISKGVFRYKGNGHYNKSSAKITVDEEAKFNHAIEESALKIMADIISMVPSSSIESFNDKVDYDECLEAEVE